MRGVGFTLRPVLWVFTFVLLLHVTKAQCPQAFQTNLIQKFEQNVCISPETLKSLGITPSNREGKTITFELYTTPSTIMSSMIVALIARDVMGYNVKFNCYSSALGGAARLSSGESDVIVEYPLDTFKTEASPFLVLSNDQSVVDAGFAGYTEQSGVYVPVYMAPFYYKNVLAATPRLADMVGKSAAFWTTFQIPEIVSLYASQNDTLFVAGLTMIANFTPPWCTPWNVDGVGNNCLDVKAEDPTYDPGVLHQMIMNLKLNMTVSYWGTGLDGPGFGNYIARKASSIKPLVFKSVYLPERSPPAWVRVGFKPYSQECYVGNTNSLEGIGSVDCDYPILSLRKMARGSIINSPPDSVLHDFASFYKRFSITQKQIDALWNAVVSATQGSGTNAMVDLQQQGREYDLSCEFVRLNNYTVKQTWSRNEYQAPNRVEWKVSSSSKSAIYAIAAIAVILEILTVFLYLCHREHPLVKSISQTYSLLTTFGFLLLSLSAILIAENKPNASICTARLWLPPIGASISLGALMAKTRRIYLIFNKITKNRALLTDWNMLKTAVIPLAIILLMLTIHEAVKPASSEAIVVDEDNTVTTYHVCEFDEDFFYSLICVLGVVVLWLTKIAYDSREAPDQFNEAKELGMAAYTMVLSVITGVPLLSWLHSKNEFDAWSVVTAMFMCMPCIGMMVFLFGERLLYACRGIEDLKTGRTVGKKSSEKHTVGSGKLGSSDHKLFSKAASSDGSTNTKVRVKTLNHDYDHSHTSRTNNPSSPNGTSPVPRV